MYDLPFFTGFTLSLKSFSSFITSDFSKPLSILVNTCCLMAPVGIATGTTEFLLHRDSCRFWFSNQ